MLRKAIKEHWEERFKIEDPSYLEEQLLKLAECDSYDDLIYHCMKERTIENGKNIETYTYPDESTVKYQLGV
jgi:hypothetical protein